MKLETLLNAIGDAWPDGSFHAVAASGGTMNCGDTLALFLYQEVYEMTDPDAGTADQLGDVYWLLDRAVKDLEQVRLQLTRLEGAGTLEDTAEVES